MKNFPCRFFYPSTLATSHCESGLPLIAQTTRLASRFFLRTFLNVQPSHVPEEPFNQEDIQHILSKLFELYFTYFSHAVHFLDSC